MAHVVLCVDFDFDREPEGISVLIREFGETELSPPSASLMAFNRNGGAGSTNITCSKDCRTFAVTLLLKHGHIRPDGESVLLQDARYVIKSVICDPNFERLVLGCIEAKFCK